MFQISADFLKWQTTSVQTLPKPLKIVKNTPALRARGLHTRSRWSSVISKRNQTNTFELMAFLWHGNSASVRLQNPLKPFKTVQNPSKHLERDPTLDVTLVWDSQDERFLETAQISLKRCRFPYISLNTPALRARGLHTRSRWSSVIRNEIKPTHLKILKKS